jgi:RNA polymerase sigma-70 factor, ECF subfamily
VLARFLKTSEDNSVMDTQQAIIAEIPKLRRFARALVGDAVAADDLVQDCLERALGRVHLWRENTNMRAWLFTILRNIHHNQRRYLARRPHETSYDEMPQPPGTTAPAQGHGITIRDLGQALDQLPDQQREVVLLVGLEDMSYKETAEILDVPLGTVMSRLARGREALERLMDSGEINDAPSQRGTS